MMETALNIGISALATEHFFTAFLSSPKACEQFLKPQDVREMFTVAAIVSLGFSALMSYLLQNPWGLVSSFVFVIVFFLVYKNAMKEKP